MRATATRNVNLNETGISSDRRQLVVLSHSLSKAKFTVNNKIEIFTRGADKFEALKRDLRNAKAPYCYNTTYSPTTNSETK